MDKQSKYQKYRETILAYGKTRVECECGETLNRNSLSRHRKSQKHKDKVGQGSDPNSIEWFLEAYGSSESDEEEEEVKCGICEKKLEDTSKCDYNDDIGEYCCKEPNCLRKFWGDCDLNEEEED